LADLAQVEPDVGVWSIHDGGLSIEFVANGSDHRFKQSFNLICFQVKTCEDRENEGSGP